VAAAGEATQADQAVASPLFLFVVLAQHIASSGLSALSYRIRQTALEVQEQKVPQHQQMESLGLAV
jgi:hypothetical protein